MKSPITYIRSGLLFLLLLPVLYAGAQQSGTNNVVNQHMLGTSGQNITTISYYDVLGREYQQVRKAYTPSGKDLVTYQNLDIQSRVVNESLPVSIAGSGNPQSWATITSNLQSQYGDASAYTEMAYESGGLGRPVSAYGAGSAWRSAGRKVSTGYTVNVSGDARLNAACYIAESQSTLRKTGNYTTGSLFVTKTTGEENEEVYEFCDKSGHTVLIRKVESGTNYDTYYVWNEFGQLVYILPPLAADQLTAVTTWSPSNDIIRKYGWYYEYDGLQQLQGAQTPGCEMAYMVYDKGGRVVLKQDGVQRSSNEWSYCVYDNIGRPAEEGICTSSQSVSSLRSTIGSLLLTVSAATSNSGYNTSNILPAVLTGRQLRKSIFYDSYSFRSQAGFDTRLPAGPLNPKGKPSGMILCMEGSDLQLRSVIHYDNKGRETKRISTNHLDGTETEETTYTFTGKPSKVVLTHTAPGKSDVRQEYNYTYDSADRQTKVMHKLNSNTDVTLSETAYDEYDRIKTRKLHASKESLTYGYNVRNWTTSISGTRFNENLTYNTGSGGLYNGNVRTMKWTSGSESVRGYTFSYNSLGFLTSAVYGEGDNLGTNSGRFTESQTYDKQGNILTQQRYGKQTSGYGQVDNLTMIYTGNQLQRVNDAATDPVYPGVFNFTNGSNETTEYTYDANGRMILDKNAGISKVSYTRSGTPLQVQFTYGHQTSFGYDADGSKRQVKHIVATENQFVPMGQAVTLPANKISSTLTTDYCGSVIYENGSVKQILTSEGYITLSGSTPTYHYYLRDHQGNNRVVMDQSGTVKQTVHYYPFGMTYGEGAITTDQPYKYNGKELDQVHGLNWYDYEARMYAGYRFTTPDPLGDQYPDLSPYAYCANNPVRFIDPTGMLLDDYVLDKNKGVLKLIKKTEDEFDQVKVGEYNFRGEFEEDNTIAALKLSKGQLLGEKGEDLSKKTITFTNIDEGLEFMQFTSWNIYKELNAWVYNRSMDVAAWDLSTSHTSPQPKYRKNGLYNIHTHPGAKDGSGGNYIPSTRDVKNMKEHPLSKYYILSREHGLVQYDANSVQSKDRRNRAYAPYKNQTPKSLLKYIK